MVLLIEPTYTDRMNGLLKALFRERKTLGDTIVCDELVKAIEGVTTNGKTKLQQG